MADLVAAQADSIAVREDEVIVGASVLANDTDEDGTAQVTEVNGVVANVGAVIQLASGALLTMNADGSYDYDPNGVFDYLVSAAKALVTGAVNSSAVDSFTYTLSGGSTATVTVTIEGVDGPGDELRGTGGDNSITGTEDADRFVLSQGGIDTAFGLGGDDFFIGGSGEDSFSGGAGNDVFIGSAGSNHFDGGDGIDRVDYSAAPGPVDVWLRVERAVANGFGGADDLWNIENVTGSAFADLISGDDGVNVLDGGAGADRLFGAGGGDIYLVDNVADHIDEQPAHDGVDLVMSSVSFNLGLHGAAIENLVLTGSTAINGTGNDLDNVITGNAGANVLTGGWGVDTLQGGGGNDVYVIEDEGDQASETEAAGGVDTVRSAVSFVLGEHIENLTLLYTSNANGTGNGANNVLTGNSGANRLDGAAGADTMRGGLGNDIYDVDNAGDVVSELFDQGTDTVRSAISYTLGANLENLTLTGTGDIFGNGNAFANVLIGNDGANILDGRGGADTMNAGLGNDIYFVDDPGDVVFETSSAGGIDEVRSSASFTLTSNIENLTLLGTGFTSGTGNGANNVLTGSSGPNVLDGMAGADTMAGGLGNDSYVVDDALDKVIEAAGAGTVDNVTSSITYTLTANVEYLVLTGAAAINGTGNALANYLTGNGANNILNGGAGADFMQGGLGDDTYVVDDQFDRVTERAGEGTDTVRSSVSFQLSAGLENLILTGNSPGGWGNDLDNVLIGNNYDNSLNGMAGADRMNGGLGNDSYLVDDAGDVVLETSATGGNDFVESFVTFTLGSNLERLLLRGTTAINGTGNALANTIYGNEAANVLDGSGGADDMAGSGGDDTYVVDNAGDVVFEFNGAGTDTVQAMISYTLLEACENLTLLGTANLNGTGNGASNVLTGNSGANTLDGRAGGDTMAGSGGNDTYVVESGLDKVIETAGGGVDTVRASLSHGLAAEVENLILTGTAANGYGNALANQLTGNDAANRLDGGAGADFMRGGLGDDVYLVDNGGDVVSELAGQGTDKVESAIDYTLGLAVENLTLTGSAAHGTGNIFANVLIGNASNNILNGGGGADTMNAGLGQDLYIVDNAGDLVFETSTTGGTDEVQSSVTFTLSANIENLTLTGAGAVDGTGNALANVLTGNNAANILGGLVGNDRLYGNGGNDQLHGGSGNDLLNGGAGLDRYHFDAALDGVNNVDIIIGFAPVDDAILLDDSVFAGLAAGTLAAGAFRVGTDALDADDRILYDSATGQILFDADGAGGVDAILFATVAVGTAITNLDFFVY